MNKGRCKRCGEIFDDVFSHCPECGFPYELPLNERPKEWNEKIDKKENRPIDRITALEKRINDLEKRLEQVLAIHVRKTQTKDFENAEGLSEI